MAAPLLTTSSTVLCPHGGQASLVTANVRVEVAGGRILLVTDQHPVSGCPFQVPAGPTTKPQPCVQIRWLVGATQTKINGTPVLTRTSVGLCFSAEQIPQGPPVIAQTQTRAMGL